MASLCPLAVELAAVERRVRSRDGGDHGRHVVACRALSRVNFDRSADELGFAIFGANGPEATPPEGQHGELPVDDVGVGRGYENRPHKRWRDNFPL